MIVMLLIKYFIGASLPDPMPRIILSFGFLIFAGYVSGEYAVKVGLPQITGYLFTGIICGPYVLNLVSHNTVVQLKIIDDLALALIAFTAGGEMKISRVRGLFKSMFSIALFQSILSAILVWGGFYLFSRYSNLKIFEDRVCIVVAAFMGAIAAASSPATAIAVIVSTKAKGRISNLTIGATVVKDLIVLVGFTLALAFGYAFTKGSAVEFSIVGNVFVMMVAAVIFGFIVAGLIALFLKYAKREAVLFMIIISLALVFVAEKLELHFILICLVAGFLVENYTSLGGKLVGAIERTSKSVYIIFFAMAGVYIDFAALIKMWPYAVVIVVLRCLGLYAGTYLAGSFSREGRCLKQYGWMGFVGQAGVSLGLCTLVARAFPVWGADFRTIIIAAIAINQIIGPVLLKVLLNMAGETAQRHIEEVLRPDKSARLI